MGDTETILAATHADVATLVLGLKTKPAVLGPEALSPQVSAAAMGGGTNQCNILWQSTMSSTALLTPYRRAIGIGMITAAHTLPEFGFFLRETTPLSDGIDIFIPNTFVRLHFRWQEQSLRGGINGGIT